MNGCLRNCGTAIVLVLVSACGGGGGGASPSGEGIVLSDNAELAELRVSQGTLDQVFQPSQPDYTSAQGFLAESVRLIPSAAESSATITVAGAALASGETSAPVALAVGEDVPVEITVTAPDGVTTKTYTVAFMRQTSDSFAQQAYVKASNAGNEDEFGYSVALSGDTLAVGAYLEDGGGDQNPDSGAVYVFTRGDAGWSQQALLKASNPTASDQFGWSVALSGDTLAVGVPSEDGTLPGIIAGSPDHAATGDGAVQSGVVYVYTRDEAGAWTQQAYVKGANTGAGDWFGYSVALDGATLAVGAPLEDGDVHGVLAGDDQSGASQTGASNSGAVYVFTRDEAGAWAQQAYVKASNTGAEDRFGHSVALSADTLAVGAHQESSAATGVNAAGQDDNNSSMSGAAYVYTRDGEGAWTQQAYVKASNTGANDQFGCGIALSGDTLAVAACLEDSAQTGIVAGAPDNTATGDGSLDSGAVYVFMRDETGEWSQQAYVKSSNTGANDQFGEAVALSGNTLAVGAYLEDSSVPGVNPDSGSSNGASASGAAYLFVRDGAGSWSQQFFLKASNAAAGDGFGQSVALSGDTLAVGADEEDSAATAVIPGSPDDVQTGNAMTGAGAVYLFR